MLWPSLTTCYIDKSITILRLDKLSEKEIIIVDYNSIIGTALSIVNMASYSSLKGLAIMADYRRYLKRM
jgi:hypothetical protein